MKLTIDEIIAKETEIAEEFQRTVDTHMVNSNLSLEQMYCDDTEVVEEELKMCKELSDYHSTIANIVRKYQKIAEIVTNNELEWGNASVSANAFLEVKKVVEDRKKDNS